MRTSEDPLLIAAHWTSAGAAVPLSADERSPVAFEARVAAASRAGFRGFGLLHADLVAVRDDLGYAAMRSVLADHGMEVVELEMLGDWWTDGPRRERSDAVLRDLVEAGRELSARHIKAGFDYTGAVVSRSTLVDGLSRLARQAEVGGVRFALEPMPFANVSTIDDAWALLQEVGSDGLGLMVDVWHVARAGSDWSAVAGLPGGAIVAVELDDALTKVEGSLLEDTLNNRKFCGEGDLDLSGFVAAVRHSGYNGPWGVEIISHELRALPVDEALRRAAQGARRALAGRARPACA